MKTLLLVAAGAAVVLTGAPASAKRYTNQVKCTRYSSAAVPLGASSR